MSQIKKIKQNQNTNRVRRIWLLLSQNSYTNLLEDLIKDIVGSKMILLINVLPLGLPYNNKQQRSLVDMLAISSMCLIHRIDSAKVNLDTEI